MAIKKRPGSDCLRQLPHEKFDDPRIAQNFHFLAQWIAEIDCRETKDLDCERLRELFVECELCELICDCPPCDVPTRLLVKFQGIPFENIYAGDAEGGTNWIGNIDTATRDYVKIFDPATGVKLAQLESNDDAVFDSQSGYGMAHHKARREVWVSGFANPAPSPAYLVLRVHHADDPFTLLKEYRYPEYGAGIAEAPIEVCPDNGDVYVGFHKELDTGNTRGGILRIDPATGAIKGKVRPENALEPTMSTIVYYYLQWHPAQKKFVVGDVHDRTWGFDPDTLDATPMGGAVGGLLKGETGEPVSEPTFSEADSRIYIVPTRYGDAYRFNYLGGGVWPGDTFGTETEKWLDWARTTADPEGMFCFYIDPLQAIVASRGTDTITFTDPTKNGLVSVIAVADKSVVREFVVGFNPARGSFCEAQNRASINSYWDQDTQWFVEFLPLEEGADATIRNPRDEDGQVIEGGGPFTPPDEDVPEPTDPTTPKDPTDPDSGGGGGGGGGGGSTEPCEPPPDIVSGVVWCDSHGPFTDINGDELIRVTTGWQMEIDTVYCKGPAGSDSENQYDIVGWDSGLDPAVDPPSEVRHFTSANPLILPETPGNHVQKVTLFDRQGPAADPPKCGGKTADPTRIQRTYYVRRNQPGETGPGALSPNSVTLTITDPAT